MYARNPERDAIWNDALEWMICRGLPLRPREIEAWVASDDRGDFFEPGPRVEQFDAGGRSPYRRTW